MSNPITFSTNMPQKFSVADGGNSFILGRRAFFNNTYKSHEIKNLGNNNTSTNSVKKNPANNPSPLLNTDSGTRIQRLRLHAIGDGSYKLKNDDDRISFSTLNNYNVIKHAIVSVRGGGAAFVPKPNSKVKSSI